MNTNRSANITWHTFDMLDGVPGLIHASSTRAGGASAVPFDSLNLAFHVGDDPEAVLANRERFAQAVGFALDDVVATHQVHGATVRVVGRRDRGTGATAPPEKSWACDALVTGERGVILMGFAADCPLVMLADASAGLVALAHAGWRPAFAGILAKTVSAMRELGAEPAHVVACVAPAIGPCCYEVGGELINALPLIDAGRFFVPRGDRFLFDLPGACEAMLLEAGLRETHIDVARMCTRCNASTLYSYRGAGGTTGRHASVIGFNGNDVQHHFL